MSKNITISEGENARAFGNTKKLKTQLQGEDAGFCFWVPEDETQANPTYIMENGLHTAKEAGEYGFSVAHVNVPGKVTDFDGTDWDIIIDEDGVPHIEIDDISVPIIDPETGLPIIDPETGLPVLEEKDIEITIDDETGEIEVTVEDKEPININPEDYDLDPDKDIDVSIDPEDVGVDMVGTDLDGSDVVVDLDPITGDFDTLDCPASIKIMHVPNKTEYTDGWAIDYDGLVVQAFDADGNPWSSPGYPDGYIPAHKLNLGQKYADYDSGQSEYVTPDYSDNVTEITSIGSIEQIVQENILTSEEATEIADNSISDLLDDIGQYDGTNVCIAYNWTMPELNPSGASGVTGVTPAFDVAFVFDPITNPVNPSQYYSGTLYRVWFNWVISEYNPDANHFTAHPSTSRASRRIFSGVDPLTGNVSSANMSGTGNRVNSVDVSWDSPCLNTFTDSFDITVNEREDHGGSHHSGKF